MTLRLPFQCYTAGSSVNRNPREVCVGLFRSQCSGTFHLQCWYPSSWLNEAPEGRRVEETAGILMLTSDEEPLQYCIYLQSSVAL